MVFLLILRDNVINISISECTVKFQQIRQPSPLWFVSNLQMIRISYRSPNFLFNHRLSIRKIYSRSIIFITFRHLFMRLNQRHYFRKFRFYILDLREELCLKLFVKSRCIFICQLYMLQLVNSYRYTVRLVKQDINCHQNGIGIQTYTAVFMTFLLVLNHRVEPVLRPNATKYPGQFSMLRNL